MIIQIQEGKISYFELEKLAEIFLIENISVQVYQNLDDGTVDFFVEESEPSNG